MAAIGYFQNVGEMFCLWHGLLFFPFPIRHWTVKWRNERWPQAPCEDFATVFENWDPGWVSTATCNWLFSDLHKSKC